MGTVKDEIAKNLQYYRKKKNLTQKELAEKIGVRHNSISSWENGVNAIDIETLLHICQVLGVSITDMYGGFDSTVPSPDSPEPKLDENIKKYLLLNAEGKKKAGERIDELLELPKYQARDKNGFTPDQLRRFAAGMDGIARAVEIICEDSKAGSMLFNMSKGKK